MFKKILIIKTGALGDLIISSCFFQTIKKNYPESKIYLLTQEIYKEVVEYCPIFETIFYLPKNRFGFLRFIKLVLRLNREKFDVIFDIQGNLKTNFYSFLIKSKKKYGFYRLKVGKLFFNGSIRKTEIRKNPVDGLLSVLKFIEIKEYVRKLRIWIPEERRKKFEEFIKENKLDKNKKWIAIHPFASPEWLTKRWMPENFAFLSDKLIEEGYEVIFIGYEKGNYINEITSKMRNRPLNLVNKTDIHTLSLLLERCLVLITGDSGPLHIGVASGTKVIGIFGPSDPELHCPPGAYYIYKKVDCSSCYKKICNDMKCMKEIKVEEVYEKIKEILKNEENFNNNSKL